jgi:hypothetical protein
MRTWWVASWSSILILLSGSVAPSQTATSDVKLAVEVTLELRQPNEWKSVNPSTVFHKNDEIRFRFRTSRAGHLYVLNHNSDGQSAWLFPRPENGLTSRVEPGPEYLVPGTKGSFLVGGAPGFDTTYWILSPAPIDTRELSQPAFGSQPSTLEPRCRDEVLKARGLCIDDRAGPGPITRPDEAPLKILRSAPLAPRDLKFHTQDSSTRISSQDAQNGVIVYEFRIAHN